MLTFVGLGLYDERSITVAGREAVAAADRVFLERYTSALLGTSSEELAAFHDVELDVLEREDVETAPEPVLEAAADGDAVVLVGGDPLVATTHVDLRLRAAERDIETRIVHGVSIASAAPALSGLQNYRFGKATTLPFPGTFPDPVPESVRGTIADNLERDLHTLVFLDIDRGEGYLAADVAAEALASTFDDRLGIALARVGSDDPAVVADRLDRLADRDLGDPLHVLILPAALHEMEVAALSTFANAPADVLPTT